MASEEAGGPSGVDGLCPRCNRKPPEGPSGGVTRAWSCVGDRPGSGMESGLGRCLSRGRQGAPAPAVGWGAADKFMGVWGRKVPPVCLDWLGPWGCLDPHRGAEPSQLPSGPTRGRAMAESALVADSRAGAGCDMAGLAQRCTAHLLGRCGTCCLFAALPMGGRGEMSSRCPGQRAG